MHINFEQALSVALRAVAPGLAPDLVRRCALEAWQCLHALGGPASIVDVDATPVAVKLEELSHMEINPGDVLVVKVRGVVPAAASDRIKLRMREIFPNNPCLIIEEGTELSTIGAPRTPASGDGSVVLESNGDWLFCAMATFVSAVKLKGTPYAVESGPLTLAPGWYSIELSPQGLVRLFGPRAARS